MTTITSRDNPRVRRWRELMRDARARRKAKRALIEGEHLVSAFVESGKRIEQLILSKSGAARFEVLAGKTGRPPLVLSDAVFGSMVDVDSPTGIAAEISIPDAAVALGGAASCVFLDAIQDAGNVGTILRSAGAFGIGHAVLGAGCADAWSPKVLRAGMGAHFAMEVLDGDLADAIAAFGGRLACTVPRGGVPIARADLSGRMGWLFGAEGQGVNDALAARAELKVSIPMPGGAESLNVAAAAAICIYECARRRSTA